MNAWAAPLALIVVLIFGLILYFTQAKPKASTELPPESETFQPISKAPAQGQAQQQANTGLQQQVQGQQSPQQTQQQAQQQQAQQQSQQLKATYNAVIKTTKGDIKVTLRADAAPNTVINFIKKAESNFYKNLTFHRVEDWVIQGGDPEGTGAGGGQMKTELNVLPFKAGSLGVARGNNKEISNDSQFFITKTEASWLDQEYTNFGNVTEGMDVVNKISIGDKILGITVDGL